MNKEWRNKACLVNKISLNSVFGVLVRNIKDAYMPNGKGKCEMCLCVLMLLYYAV